MCMGVLPGCSSQERQKVLDALGLELQVAVSCYVGNEKLILVLWKSN